MNFGSRPCGAAIARRKVGAAPRRRASPPPQKCAVALVSSPCNCARIRSTGPPGANCTMAKLDQQNSEDGRDHEKNAARDIGKHRALIAPRNECAWRFRSHTTRSRTIAGIVGRRFLGPAENLPMTRSNATACTNAAPNNVRRAARDRARGRYRSSSRELATSALAIKASTTGFGDADDIARAMQAWRTSEPNMPSSSSPGEERHDEARGDDVEIEIVECAACTAPHRRRGCGFDAELASDS